MNSGKSASLSTECKEGKMFLKLEMQICFGDFEPHRPYYSPAQPRQPGPSRLRRRARRAHARTEAAAKAAPNPPPEAAAEQAVPTVPQTTEAAVQAVPETEDAAVQAADFPPTIPAAVQAGQQERPPYQAAQAQQPEANPSPAVRDVFCPDGDYLAGYRAEHERDRHERANRRREEHERDLENFKDMLDKSLKTSLDKLL